jgi:hypothetical protein
MFVFLVDSKLNVKEVESNEISYKSLSSTGLYSILYTAALAVFPFAKVSNIVFPFNFFLKFESLKL